MAHPMPPVSPCAPWLCSGTSTPMGFARAATTRLVALRSTTSMASSITPTGSTIYSSPPPWEGENYEPRNPMESERFDAGGGIAKRPTALARQVLHRLLFLRRLDGGALHGAEPGPDTHDGEVIHDGFDHARIGRVGAALAGVKAVGIPGVFE